MKEPVWVRTDVVYAIHRRQIAEHGGGEGIRDGGLLDSAPEGVLSEDGELDSRPLDVGAAIAGALPFGAWLEPAGRRRSQ